MSNTKTSIGERLVLRRTYAAKRERVWRAWTDIKEAMTWSAPEGMTVPEFTADMRVGGAYRLTMLQPDGEKFIAKGIYREITPSQKLVYTWTWEEDTPQDEHETLLTVEFLDRGEQTEVVLTHENLASEESRERHSHGWNQFLDKLGRHLEAKQ